MDFDLFLIIEYEFWNEISRLPHFLNLFCELFYFLEGLSLVNFDFLGHIQVSLLQVAIIIEELVPGQAPPDSQSLTGYILLPDEQSFLQLFQRARVVGQ